ncbi:MAG: hypothetical protein IJB75_05375 [Oscillospiraceae bacterium]|nr:hypothetical protein [Oscillospiraceae bacterium]
MKQPDRAGKAPKKPNFLVRLLALALTAVLILGAVSLVVFREQLNLDALRRWLHYRSIQTGQTGQTEPFTHGGGDSLDIACLEDGYLFSSTAGAHYYAFSGKELESHVVHTEKPVLSGSNRFGVTYNAGGDTLYLFGGGKQSRTYSPESGGILSARVTNSGWVAVTALQSHYRGAVTVLDNEQQPVIRLNYSSAFVCDAVLSPDERTVAVVTLSQTEGSVQSTLHLQRVDASEPFASVVLDGFVVLDMDFDSSGIWLLGQSSLITLSAKGTEQHEYSFDPDHLKGYSLDGDGFAVFMLGRYRAGAANQVITTDHDGTVLGQLPLKRQVLSLCARGRYVALLDGHELNIYTRNLSLYDTLDDTQSARHVALCEDAGALLADSQEAWLYIPS